MNLFEQYGAAISRRHFFGRGALGLGVPALASLVAGATSQTVFSGELAGDRAVRLHG